MFIYAQINNENVCTGISSLSSLLDDRKLIPVSNEDLSVIGKQWNGSLWLDVPAPPPLAQPLTQLEFLRRFTAQERITIRASTDPVIVDFLHLVSLAQDILVTDEDTVMGVNYLAQQGLISPERVAEILA